MSSRLGLDIFSPSGHPLGKLSPATLVSPKDLVTSKRLDLAVKYNFARFLNGKGRRHRVSSPDILYSSHIELRTGGVEPYGIFKKRSIEDYLSYFKIVNNQIREYGFDENEPIYVSSKTGLVLNGAHRLAVSIEQGIPLVPVVYDSNSEGRTWDFFWFLEAGFSRSDLAEIASNYLEITSKNYNAAIVWPSDNVHFHEVLKEIKERSGIIYVDCLDSQHNLKEFLFDVYSYDKGIDVGRTNDNILQKFGRLSEKSIKDIGLIIFETETFEDSIELRNDVRSIFKNRINGPDFDIIHSGCSPDERDHIANIILSIATLDSYKIRPELSQNLIEKIHVLRNWAKENSFSIDNLAVVGGAALDLYGQKKCDDIDIIMRYRDRRERWNDGSAQLSFGLDLAGFGYANHFKRESPPTDDEIISCRDMHVMARGVKFATLDTVLARKRYSHQKAKNREDIRNYALSRLKIPINLESDEAEALYIGKAAFEQLKKLAEKYHAEGKLHIASSYYRKITEEWPKSDYGWLGLGICAVQRGDMSYARDYLEKAAGLGTSKVARSLLSGI
ncbi:hypothetical protein [Geoalkalibacter halelectricus]|uniref:hypothetical protein n=1 Tax=Geoalkalibacter halelectricus TaxID=2847045 RepID=UPI00266F3FF8|nr:hypothetical protein [Geoalkalibacter halelectricus]MDO3377965.1 hypothetical protein [Geoalkalibacter halelectricus]